MKIIDKKKKKRRRERDVTQARRPCEDGGGDWGPAATNQGAPGAFRPEKRQEWILPQSIWKKHGHAQHIDFGHYVSRIMREYIFYISDNIACGALLRSLQELICSLTASPNVLVNNQHTAFYIFHAYCERNCNKDL